MERSNIDALRKAWLAEEAASFEGWDFSRLTGRRTEDPLPWDYRGLLGAHLQPQHQLLDMGTGGGEFLLELGHPHANTCVTEAYPPNVALCLQRLAPLGITVRQIAEDDQLPYADAAFDIVLNRHESFDVAEVFRVLKPGEFFITQQVGEENNRDLSRLLIEGFTPNFGQHTLAANQILLQNAGFIVLQSGECFPKTKFTDIGAVAYYAKIIEWEFPGFSVNTCFDALLRLQACLKTQGYIESTAHRFFLVCEKPGN